MEKGWNKLHVWVSYFSVFLQSITNNFKQQVRSPWNLVWKVYFGPEVVRSFSH